MTHVTSTLVGMASSSSKAINYSSSDGEWSDSLSTGAQNDTKAGCRCTHQYHHTDTI